MPELALNFCVTLNVSCKLGYPIFSSGMWRAPLVASLVLVPETAMDKDYALAGRKDEIGLTGKCY